MKSSGLRPDRWEQSQIFVDNQELRFSEEFLTRGEEESAWEKQTNSNCVAQIAQVREQIISETGRRFSFPFTGINWQVVWSNWRCPIPITSMPNVNLIRPKRSWACWVVRATVHIDFPTLVDAHFVSDAPVQFHDLFSWFLYSRTLLHLFFSVCLSCFLFTVWPCLAIECAQNANQHAWPPMNNAWRILIPYRPVFERNAVLLKETDLCFDFDWCYSMVSPAS